MTPIGNFDAVIDGKIWRGSQPLSNDAWLFLASIGVKNVLKLNYPDENEGQDNTGYTGINVFDCPMPPKDFWQAVGRPDDKDVKAALAFMMNESHWPMFIHCRHGEDRTGLICGMFRVAYCKWSPIVAFSEMKTYGFHDELIDLYETWIEFLKVPQ